MVISVRVFGDISGLPEGSIFTNRQELSESGMHRPSMAGIGGSQNEGADSIVLSGGYTDDEDYGEHIIYTGHGGQNVPGGTQTADQQFNRGNKALALNCDLGLPVRLIRGYQGAPEHSPNEGYRYDGLFRVERYWSAIGTEGFKIYRFYLSKILQGSSERIHQTLTLPSGQSERRTVTTQVTRVVRDTTLSKSIKRLYGHRCQICGIQLVLKTGPYAEAAHIKPLGEPHNGPDISSNIICLCPNHHVEFDGGIWGINDDYSLIGMDGSLEVVEGHILDPEFLEYHRRIHELK